tara:strand:- start:5310 stop:5567 length:258 start_codon:yes stop_codon:yes gene_type:complete
MCLFNQSRPSSAPKPPPLPPASPPPAPAPEPPKPPEDLQANKEGVKVKQKQSRREAAGIVNKGSGQLRIPLNTGSDAGPSGGVNV